MKCWKCGMENEMSITTCVNCGAGLARTDPLTNEGKALRRIFDLYGPENLFENTTLLINALGDLLPQEIEFKDKVKKALNAGIGQVYIETIKKEGTKSERLSETIKSLLYSVGMTDNDTNEIISTFDEMIGWNTISVGDNASISLEFTPKQISVGKNSIIPLFSYIPIKNFVCSEYIDWFAALPELQLLYQTSNTRTRNVSAISLPVATVQEQLTAEYMLSLARPDIAFIISSSLTAFIFYISSIITKSLEKDTIALCIVYYELEYEIGLVSFSPDGIIEVLCKGIRRNNNVLGFEDLRQDIYSVIDFAHIKSFSRIFVSSEMPVDMCRELERLFHISVKISDKDAVMKGLFQYSDQKSGKAKDPVLLLDTIDYSIRINNSRFIEYQTTIPFTTNSLCVPYRGSKNSNNLPIHIEHMLGFCKPEVIKLPIGEIIDREGEIFLSVVCSIDNEGHLDVSVTNQTNGRSVAFDWKQIIRFFLSKPNPFAAFNEENFELYIKAKGGDIVAQNNLGYNYQYGLGVPQDYQQAFAWYRKSAEQGNSAAQNNLGICYENGFGTEQNLSQAVMWYIKSAEQGNMYGQYDLAECYEKGKGISQCKKEAQKWYQRSADQGLSCAIDALKRI